MNPWHVPQQPRGGERPFVPPPLSPSPLTQRIIEQSPRRKGQRYGYEFYRKLKQSTLAENERFEREQGRYVPYATTESMDVEEQVEGAGVETHSMAFSRAMRFLTAPEERTRFLLARPLKPAWEHQEIGTAFIKFRETASDGGVKGGIFADLMRLGKTKEIVDALVYELQDRVRAGHERFGEPTLWVCPPQAIDTLLHQIHVHYGPPQTRPFNLVVLAPKYLTSTTRRLSSADLLGTYDLIITTYNALTAMYDKKENGHAEVDDEENNVVGLPNLLQLYYRRVVADEAHVFCNPGTILFHAMLSLQAQARWYVTGTPIRNRVKDLYSAFAFLGVPRPFPPVESEAFYQLLHSIMIRRTAEDVGVSVQRTTVTETNVLLEFASPAERRLYDQVYRHTQKEVAAVVDGQKNTKKNQKQKQKQEEEEVKKKGGNTTIALLVRLRQICAQPKLADSAVRHLVQEDFIIDPDPQTAEGLLYDAMAEFILTGANKRAERDPRIVLLNGLTPADRKRLLRKIVAPISTKERHILAYYKEHIEFSVTGDKLIIFSPWASFLRHLDRVFTLLSRYAHVPPPHVMVHGEVADQDRHPIFQRFRTDPTCTVLLCTTGTGEVSLDLSCANHAIFPDPWYNPHTEDQTASRLLGANQTKPVFILRLGIKDSSAGVSDSIDEEIMRIAAKKRQMNEILVKRATQPMTDVDVDGGALLLSWIMRNPAVERPPLAPAVTSTPITAKRSNANPEKSLRPQKRPRIE